MKKKLLECPVHGETLFRCKRQDWKGAPGKPFATQYTEKCFKCLSLGLAERKEKVVKRSKHLSMKA